MNQVKKKEKKTSNDRFAKHEVLQYLDSNVAALQVRASSSPPQKQILVSG